MTSRFFGTLRRLLPLTLCAFVTGCARLPTFHPIGEAAMESDAQTICRSLVARRQTTRSARALVNATVRAGGDVASLRYAIVTKEPGRMRIDLLPLEGAYTLGLLVVNRDGATLIDATNQTFVRENDAERLTGEFVGLPGLTPEVVLALVTGQLPALSCSSSEVFRGRDGAVMIRDRESRIVWEVAPDSTRIKSVHMLTQSGERVEALVTVRGDDVGFPTLDFSVFSPATASAEMIVRKLTINKDIPDELFTVAVPSGYSRQ
jgi:outer membrane lipoprotein-sorting protein